MKKTNEVTTLRWDCTFAIKEEDMDIEVPKRREAPLFRSRRFYTFNANSGAIQNPAPFFERLDIFNFTVLTFASSSGDKAFAFEQCDERFRVVHPFMGMKILPGVINAMEEMPIGGGWISHEQPLIEQIGATSTFGFAGPRAK